MRSISVLVFLCALLSGLHALNCRSGGGYRVSDLKNTLMTCVKKHMKNLRGESGRNRNNGMSASANSGIMRNQGGNNDFQMGSDDENPGSNQYQNTRDMNRNRPTNRYGDQNDDQTQMPGYNNNNQFSYQQPYGDPYSPYRDNSFRGPPEQYGGHRPQDPTYGSGSYQNENRDMNSRYFPSDNNYGSHSNKGQNGRQQQENPNRFGSDDDFLRMNSSFSLKSIKNHECIIHCFLENLEMTSSSGMPDKYMVTQVLMKDVRDNDLKDFLQDSIEECFELLQNDNIRDKCKFSKTLMTCLTEKGKANCDDWNSEMFQV